MKQTAPGCAGRLSPVRIAELASGREDKPPIRWFIGGTVGEGLYPAVEDSHATCFDGLIPEPHAPPNRPQAPQLRGRTLLSRGGRCAWRSVFRRHMTLRGRDMQSEPLSRRKTWPRVTSEAERQWEMSSGLEDGMMMTATGCSERDASVRIAVVAGGRDRVGHAPVRPAESQATGFAGLNPEPYAPPNRPQASQPRDRGLLTRGGRCAWRSNLMPTVPLRTSNIQHRTPNATRPGPLLVPRQRRLSCASAPFDVRCSVLGVRCSILSLGSGFARLSAAGSMIVLSRSPGWAALAHGNYLAAREQRESS